jgi:alpha-tubulin suppressor-like RCC1 family protein
MLDFETVEVDCGQTHVVAVTADQEVFSWGRGDHGQLGLSSHDSYSTPQRVALPPPLSVGQEGVKVAAVCCGSDCSLLITSTGRLLAAGNNRFNRRGILNDAPHVINT